METNNENEERRRNDRRKIEEVLSNRDVYLKKGTLFYEVMLKITTIGAIISIFMDQVVFLAIMKSFPNGVPLDLQIPMVNGILYSHYGYVIFTILALYSGSILFYLRRKNKLEFESYFSGDVEYLTKKGVKNTSDNQEISLDRTRTKEMVNNRDGYMKRGTLFYELMLKINTVGSIVSFLFYYVTIPFEIYRLPEGRSFPRPVQLSMLDLTIYTHYGLYIFTLIAIISGIILFCIRRNNKLEFETYFSEDAELLAEKEIKIRQGGDRRNH